MQTDLGTTPQATGLIGDKSVLVSESGIETLADVGKFRAAGGRAVVIGETLLRSDDVAATARELFHL